jgi:hypothetical protein
MVLVGRVEGGWSGRNLNMGRQVGSNADAKIPIFFFVISFENSQPH